MLHLIANLYLNIKQNTMKKSLLLLTFFFAYTYVHTQTVVSGGIFSNTTWTEANSPYIANSVVVFPNVTLTIQPGVVVKINGILEIRQGTLIAQGTSIDSIAFTTDTNTNIALWLHNVHSAKISYCNFYGNSDRAMEAGTFSNSDSITIKNSIFYNNYTGIYGIPIGHISIDSCIFKNNSIAIHQTCMTITNSIFNRNQNALLLVQNANIQNCIIDYNTVIGIESRGFDKITNCQINNNGIGIKCTSGCSYGSNIYKNVIKNNSIGIQLSNQDLLYQNDSIYCNEICYNTTFNIEATTQFNSIVANNYWCTNDSNSVAVSIYDAYDNASVGLVYFMPIDTLQCYLVTSMNNPIESQNKSFKIFPNPFSSQTIMQTDNILNNATLTVDNCFGQIVKQLKNISGQTVTLHCENLPSGMYFLRLAENNKIILVEKLLIINN